MTEIDPVDEVLAGQTFTEAVDADLPEPWRPIAHGADAATRRASALARWNADLVALIPRFWAVLGARLVDVRAVTLAGAPVLVYLVHDDQGGLVGWVGRDPRGTEPRPSFWEHVPAPLRTFLGEVHAGFTVAGHEHGGPWPPAWMQTLAVHADWPEGIPGWIEDDDEDDRIASTRLLIVMFDGGQLYYCASPDLRPDQVALVYEGDVDPQPLGPVLDEYLIRQLDRPPVASAGALDRARAALGRLEAAPQARYAEVLAPDLEH